MISRSELLLYPRFSRKLIVKRGSVCSFLDR